MDESIHKRFCTLANSLRATESTIRNNVSSHILRESVSFSNLEEVRLLIPQNQKNDDDTLTDYIATLGDKLVLSIKKGIVDVPKEPEQNNKQHKKRKRDSSEWSSQMFDLVSDAAERIKKNHPSVSQKEVDEARIVLTRMVSSLKGAGNEDLVQSFGIFRKQLRPSDSDFALLIAVRLNSGVAVSISSLKRALGSCWRDGLLTSQDSALGIGDVDLPLTPEGVTAKAHGNLPMLIVSPVHKANEDAVAQTAPLNTTKDSSAPLRNA